MLYKRVLQKKLFPHQADIVKALGHVLQAQLQALGQMLKHKHKH